MGSSGRKTKAGDMSKTKEFDLVGAIMDYESDQMDETQTLAFFQHLVNTGEAWTLQGHYGRTATALLDAGLITRPKDNGKTNTHRRRQAAS